MFLGLFALAGCSEEKNEVTGTVTFDDKPIEEGVIKFEPVDKNSPLHPEGGIIKDGKYTVKAKPGSYKVTVEATREKKDADGKPVLVAGMNDKEPEKEMYIPTKYSDRDKTELKFDVAKGSNKKDWPLSSK
jgi:hypothetical protein